MMGPSTCPSCGRFGAICAHDPEGCAGKRCKHCDKLRRDHDAWGHCPQQPKERNDED